MFPLTFCFWKIDAIRFQVSTKYRFVDKWIRSFGINEAKSIFKKVLSNKCWPCERITCKTHYWLFFSARYFVQIFSVIFSQSVFFKLCAVIAGGPQRSRWRHRLVVQILRLDGRVQQVSKIPRNGIRHPNGERSHWVLTFYLCILSFYNKRKSEKNNCFILPYCAWLLYNNL